MLTAIISPADFPTSLYFLGGVGDFMNLGGVGDFTLRDGVGDFGMGVEAGVLAGVGLFTPRDGVGDLGMGVEAGVEAGVGLFMETGVWDLGVGVGVLEGAAGGGAGVAAVVLGCPSLGSGIFSPSRYTLTVISTNSPPYLFLTLMLYLPESSGVTLLMTMLANLPPSKVTLVCSLEATSCSFLNQETSGAGSPHTVQVRLRDCGEGGGRSGQNVLRMSVFLTPQIHYPLTSHL